MKYVMLIPTVMLIGVGAASLPRVAIKCDMIMDKSDDGTHPVGSKQAHIYILDDKKKTI